MDTILIRVNQAITGPRERMDTAGPITQVPAITSNAMALAIDHLCREA